MRLWPDCKYRFFVVAGTCRSELARDQLLISTFAPYLRATSVRQQAGSYKSSGGRLGIFARSDRSIVGASLLANHAESRLEFAGSRTAERQCRIGPRSPMAIHSPRQTAQQLRPARKRPQLVRADGPSTHARWRLRRGDSCRAQWREWPVPGRAQRSAHAAGRWR